MRNSFVRLSLVFLFLTALYFPSAALADHNQIHTLQQLIDSLTVQLQQLQQQQGGTAQSTPVPAPTPVPTPAPVTVPVSGIPSCPVPPITQTLAKGSTNATSGNQVSSWQKFLAQQGFLSQSSVTGFFGTVTQNATQQWQCKYSVVCGGSPGTTGWGAVESTTRAKILEVCGSTQPTINSSAPQTNSTIPPGTKQNFVIRKPPVNSQASVITTPQSQFKIIDSSNKLILPVGHNSAGDLFHLDSNSPLHWEGDTLNIFVSQNVPFKGIASDVFTMPQYADITPYNNEVPGGRWIEATYMDTDGSLYGWYHNEPADLCFTDNNGDGVDDIVQTAPQIGAAKWDKNMNKWIDLGIILKAPPKSENCNSKNLYFNGGHGDFSVILDPKSNFFYFLFSSYYGNVNTQGVAMARMAKSDLNMPQGKVWKWYNGVYNSPGLGGEVTPSLQAKGNWDGTSPGGVDAFWGPSVHFNTYLNQYVMLLNHATVLAFGQEGVYISFNSDISKPLNWSNPVKIIDGVGWYPQIVGTSKANKETDKLAGKNVRLFIYGESNWEINFISSSPSAQSTNGWSQIGQGGSIKRKIQLVNGLLYGIGTDSGLYKLSGSDWKRIGREDNAGISYFFVVNENLIYALGGVGPEGGNIYKWDGSSWSVVRDALNNTGLGKNKIQYVGGTLYTIGAANELYRLIPNESWEHVGSNLIPPKYGYALDFDAVGTNEIYLVGTDRKPYRWNGAGWIELKGTKNKSGFLKGNIQAYGSGVYGIGNDEGLYKWTGESNTGKGVWNQVGSGYVKDYQALSDNWIVGIGLTDNVYFWNGIRWDQAGNLSAKDDIITVSPTQEIYTISSDNKVYKWIPTGTTSKTNIQFLASVVNLLDTILKTLGIMLGVAK